MHMEWETVTDNPQVASKKEFAKMCCVCNTSPKLALRIYGRLLVNLLSGEVTRLDDLR